MAAPAANVFAMKTFAARGCDEDNLCTLTDLVNTTTVDAALELCEASFPSKPLSPKITGNGDRYDTRICLDRFREDPRPGSSWPMIVSFYSGIVAVLSLVVALWLRLQTRFVKAVK